MSDKRQGTLLKWEKFWNFHSRLVSPWHWCADIYAGNTSCQFRATPRHLQNLLKDPSTLKFSVINVIRNSVVRNRNSHCDLGHKWRKHHGGMDSQRELRYQVWAESHTFELHGKTLDCIYWTQWHKLGEAVDKTSSTRRDKWLCAFLVNSMPVT